jgi:hypothetical protein
MQVNAQASRCPHLVNHFICMRTANLKTLLHARVCIVMGLKAAPGAGGLLDLLTEENSSILLPGSSSDKDDANVLQRTLSHILDLSPGEQLSIKNSTDVRHLLEERYAAVSPQLEPGEVPAGRVGPRRVAVEPSSSFSMSTPDLWYVPPIARRSGLAIAPGLPGRGQMLHKSWAAEGYRVSCMPWLIWATC